MLGLYLATLFKLFGLQSLGHHVVNTGVLASCAALFFLLLSGLQIFNAHPALYWGAISTFDDPIVTEAADENRPADVQAEHGAQDLVLADQIALSGKPRL